MLQLVTINNIVYHMYNINTTVGTVGDILIIVIESSIHKRVKAQVDSKLNRGCKDKA